MAQTFHPSMNTIARVSIFGAVFIGTAILSLPMILMRTPYMTEVGVVRDQPVPFSHKHHVGDIGLDCRYCHTSVEESSFAGIPPTKTCMNCHSQLFTDSAMLEPVRDSMQTGKPLQWTRVHDVPDYAYFNHSIHIHKGIACTKCHGQVNEMPLMWREKSLHMGWCLECHQQPELYVGKRADVFKMTGVAPVTPTEAQKLVAEYDVKSKTSCYTCHR